MTRQRGQAELIFSGDPNEKIGLLQEFDGRLPKPLTDFLAAGEHAAIDFVVAAFAEAARAGLNVLDPDVAEHTIALGIQRCREDHDRMRANPGRDPSYWHGLRAKREEQHEQASVVYFMRIGNRVKIGYSTNLPARMATFNPEELMATEPGGPKREAELHQRFASHRVHGEWFRLEGEVADYISTLQEVQRGRGAAG